jgi:hypothetical protein
LHGVSAIIARIGGGGKNGEACALVPGNSWQIIPNSKIIPKTQAVLYGNLILTRKSRSNLFYETFSRRMWQSPHPAARRENIVDRLYIFHFSTFNALWWHPRPCRKKCNKNPG